MKAVSLTERQMQIGAQMRKAGYSRAAIASRLGLSRASVSKLFPQAVSRAQPAGRMRR